MRYFDFLRDIQEISNSHILVNEYGEGDIYEYLNSGEHKYPCVFLTVTNLTTSISGTQINFTLFYTDRLVEDNSNKKSIQSTGINVIKQVLSKFEQEHPTFAIDSVNYQPFTEKFADMCAGVFCNVVLENPTDNIESYDNECEEGAFELKTITLTANGIYDVIGYDKAVVAVPEIILNDIIITENGIYKADEGGYGEVVVDVAVGSNKIKVNKVEVENNCIVDGTWTGFDNLDKTTLTTLNNMFSECSNLINLDADGWVTNNVKNITFMFSGCVNLKNLNVSNWDTSNITSLWNIFQNCQAIDNLDLSGWNTGKVTSMLRAFYGCKSLKSLDLSNWNVGNVTDMSYMFYGCDNLRDLNLSGWDVRKVQNFEQMFSLINSHMLNLSNWNTVNLTEARKITFPSLANNINLSGWNTSNFTNMYGMFSGCITLNTITGLSDFNTSKVKSMERMFTQCREIDNLDLSNWDVSKVTDMGSMFSGCESLKSLNISNWDTSSVTDMTGMFNYCVNLENIDVSGWNTSSVTNMYCMFYQCFALKQLDLTNWSAINVTDISNFSNGNMAEAKTNITNYVGGKTIDEVITNNITILNGLNTNSNQYLLSDVADRASIRALINGLADLIGSEPKTLYLSSTLISKLTDEDKAIATAKNWRIS